jgi:hypothetical protein
MAEYDNGTICNIMIPVCSLFWITYVADTIIGMSELGFVVTSPELLYWKILLNFLMLIFYQLFFCGI